MNSSSINAQKVTGLAVTLYCAINMRMISA